LKRDKNENEGDKEGNEGVESWASQEVESATTNEPNKRSSFLGDGEEGRESSRWVASVYTQKKMMMKI